MGDGQRSLHEPRASRFAHRRGDRVLLRSTSQRYYPELSEFRQGDRFRTPLLGERQLGSRPVSVWIPRSLHHGSHLGSLLPVTPRTHGVLLLRRDGCVRESHASVTRHEQLFHGFVAYRAPDAHHRRRRDRCARHSIRHSHWGLHRCAKHREGRRTRRRRGLRRFRCVLSDHGARRTDRRKSEAHFLVDNLATWSDPIRDPRHLPVPSHLQRTAQSHRSTAFCGTGSADRFPLTGFPQPVF